MKGKAGAGIGPLFPKSIKGAARLNVPTRQTNRYLQNKCIPEGFGIYSKYILNGN